MLVQCLCLFSAYAEVFLVGIDDYQRLPYFSLPTQRCFRDPEARRRLRELFSAYAEVFPRLRRRSSRSASFLCLRRGVSDSKVSILTVRNFSLPTQRCFLGYGSLIPDPVTFLCLRRGVSPIASSKYVAFSFSLPTQRCFCGKQRKGRGQFLFSAYAEVFLRQKKQ